MKQRALFIVNPVSGGKKKDSVPGLIRKYLNQQVYEADIVFTERISHARELTKESLALYDIVVAVGGDGTVNEVATALVGTKVLLGIIPFGSGNGLARFLHIPMNAKKAIEAINNQRSELIDTANLNGHPFFNMAGMGFDAHISEMFSHHKARGFITYVKTSLKEIARYKAQIYQLEIDGVRYRKEAFMLSFANSSQYGNNAHVSPTASVQDGLIDVCVIKPFPLYRFPEMCLRMFTKTADSTRFVEIIKGKRVLVEREQAGPVHLDGEPHILGAEAEINIVPGSLRVIVGSTYKS